MEKEEENDSDKEDNDEDGQSQNGRAHDGGGRDECNNWEDIVSKAIESAQLKTTGALKKAACILASLFRSAEVAYVNKDDIVDAIMQGLSGSEQVALAPNFSTRETEPTKEDQAKRDQRTRAQKTMAYYFCQIFLTAFGVD